MQNPQTPRGRSLRRRERLSVVTLCFAAALVSITLLVLWKPVAAQHLHPQERDSQFYTRTISGRVTFSDGKPVAGVTVRANFTRHMTGAPGENHAVTDASGRYSMPVAASEFSVALFASDKPYLGSSQTVDVRQTSANSINLTVRLGPRVMIRVSDAISGRPVSGMVVVHSGAVVGQTGAEGTFAFRMGDSFSGGNVELRAEGANRTLMAAPDYSFYRTFQVSPLGREQECRKRDHSALVAEQEATWDVRTYDSGSSPPVMFQGTVLGPDGQPAVGALVTMRRNSQTVQATSDEAGRWAFQTYRIDNAEAQSRSIAILAQRGAGRSGVPDGGRNVDSDHDPAQATSRQHIERHPGRHRRTPDPGPQRPRG